MILTSPTLWMLFIACGVIKMYCRPMARRAAEIIIFMLISRLTLSMKTSLALVSIHIAPSTRGQTYNSSRQRIGEPMASQRESNRQMVENDFSPPESVFVCLPAPLATVMSG